MDEEKKKVNKNTKVKKETTKKRTRKKTDEFYKEEQIMEKETIENKKNEERYSKNSFGLFEVIIIMIVTTLFGLFLGSFIAYRKYNKNDTEVVEGDIERIYGYIKDEYNGEVNEEEIVNSSVKGMIDSLTDPYAAFIDKKTALDLNEELRGNFTGLGVEIGDIGDGYITVVNIFDNSPASKAGILIEDKIIKVDGQNVDASKISDLAYEIKSSKEGSTKKVSILRGEEELEFEIKLEKVEIDSVHYISVESNNKTIGVIAINTFANNTYSQFMKAYDELSKKKLDSLIIDLRYNGGGYLSSANDIASLFVEKDIVLYQKKDKKETIKVKNEKDKTIDIPVVIVVNEETASSAEVFASSLHDNIKNTVIVGVKTFGKGTVQKLYPLSNGAYVKFTTQEWLTPNGNKIEGVGITPDVEIVIDNDEDTQLQKAIEIASGNNKEENS
ncbi:MAG: S41 family peptidase [Bacilli bacterium]|nr:S41 family peptidase [Bacilli bacterium]